MGFSLKLQACFLLCWFCFAQLFFFVVPAKAFFWGGVSIKNEKEMGQKFDAMLRTHLAIVDDPEVSQYAERLLRRLVKAMPPQPYQFTSTVILNNALNAFAVPGGYVYLLTGLIMQLDKEEDVAGILAHELAHVTLRHVAARMERAQYLTAGSLLLAIAGVALGGAGGAALAAGALSAGQSAMLNYSRLDENEADLIGLQYLLAAGYPPSGMIGGFKVLRKKSWMNGTSIPTYLSTHPDLGDRINGLQARINTMPEKIRNRTQDNRQFLRVKTLLWARYGDPQSALQRFSSSDALSCMGRGMLFLRQNNIVEANKAFEQALALAPSDALILREAGIFHFRKGDLGKAESLLTKAMRLDPQDYMTGFFYARLLDETNRQRLAENYYKEVLRHLPNDAEVHEAYAKSLAKTGKTCEGYLHLTYSALYNGNKKQAKRYLEQTKTLARTDKQKQDLNKLEKIYNARMEILNK